MIHYICRWWEDPRLRSAELIACYRSSCLGTRIFSGTLAWQTHILLLASQSDIYTTTMGMRIDTIWSEGSWKTYLGKWAGLPQGGQGWCRLCHTHYGKRLVSWGLLHHLINRSYIYDVCLDVIDLDEYSNIEWCKTDRCDPTPAIISNIFNTRNCHLNSCCERERAGWDDVSVSLVSLTDHINSSR